MLGAELALIIVLAQQPRTVALVFIDHKEIVSLIDAQREFRKLDSIARNEEQEKRHAALVVALGTLPDRQKDAAQFLRLSPSRREQLRWMRPALQNPRREP